jgi:hypothetical protein
MLQLRFRVLLHDASAPFRAKHTLIHQMVFVALNEANDRSAVFLFSRHLDAAATGAHVARREMRFLFCSILELNGAVGGRRERCGQSVAIKDDSSNGANR